MIKLDYKQIQTNIYTKLLLAYALTMLFLSSIRAFGYIINFDYFSSLSFGDVVVAFIVGMQGDAMVATYCGFIPMVAILILKAFRAKFIFIKIAIALWVLCLGIVGFSYFGAISFLEVHHRVPMSEIKLVESEIWYTLELTFSTYLLRTLSLFLALIGFFVIFCKLFCNATFANTANNKLLINGICLVVFIVFVFINGRGWSFKLRPFDVSNGYAYGKIAGDLAVNGALLTLKAYEIKEFNHNHQNLQEAIKQYKDIYKSTKFINDDKNPLYKRYIADKTKKAHNYNVVIILVESLNYFKKDNPLYKLTPFLNSIKPKSVGVKNFYANGRYSIIGITNTLASTSRAMGIPTIGWGYELAYNGDFTPFVFKKHNYKTLFLQASPRNSFYLDQVSPLIGFDEYYGGQDYPKTGDEQTHTSLPWRHGWDGDMFRFALKKINDTQKQNKPFFMFMFTATMHFPRISAGGKYDVYPNLKETGGMKAYANTMHYTDAQIGQFIQQAQKEPWFDNTIFVITADHRAGDAGVGHEGNKEQDKYQIPFVMYAPKILKPQELDIVASHIDIMPSLMQVLNWDDKFMSTGKSIFDTSVKKEDRFVWVTDYNFIKIFDKDNYSTKIGNKPIDAKYTTNANDRVKQLSKSLLTIDQVVYEFLTPKLDKNK